MPIRLDSTSPDFSKRFAAFLATKRETAEDVDQAVRAIIADVRAKVAALCAAFPAYR